MPIALALAFALAAPASPIPGVPFPPGGEIDPVLTQVLTDRAAVETRQAVARLDADTSRSLAEKAELKKRLGNLKIAVFTTPKSLDESVAAYERQLPQSRFIFAERNLEADLRDGLKSGAIQADAAAVAKAAGQRGRSARWNRADGALEIDIEDHFIDPRTGAILARTIVLVTSLGD
ncbi:MAG TPA: hypothetical protein VFZ57_07320 [Thermoanaerobaculia bacterium]|nr:hypothetical protein [Thermoanaerobaculia bacterium]